MVDVLKSDVAIDECVAVSVRGVRYLKDMLGVCR